jgi:ferredoxin
MKINIDQEACIECGSCQATCPDVFVLPPGEKSHVVEKYRVNGHGEQGEVPTDLEKCAQEAADLCPVTAISTEK